LTRCKTSKAGGRSYFLPAKPTPEEIQKVLTGDAGIHPTLEVKAGETSNWLHILHRQKDNRDVFFICNQNHLGEARKFTLKLTAQGEPECWDPMRNEITAIPYRRLGADSVEVDLTLEPSESVLLVFAAEKRKLPPRDATAKPAIEPLVVTRDAVAAVPAPVPQALNGRPFAKSPATADVFVGHCDIPGTVDLTKSDVILTMDELAPEAAARVTVNGRDAGGFIGKPYRLTITTLLKPGTNTLRIEPFAPKQARLIVVPR
jgi:hypothetical protein